MYRPLRGHIHVQVTERMTFGLGFNLDHIWEREKLNLLMSVVKSLYEGFFLHTLSDPIWVLSRVWQITTIDNDYLLLIDRFSSLEE